MADGYTVDATDARLLLAMTDDNGATVVALANRVGLSRNTVQARLARFQERGVLSSFDRRVNPAALGYPLTAYVSARVAQRMLMEVATSLERIPEVIGVQGISGEVDLLIEIVGRDAGDLYRIAGQILAVPGIERTNTALVMRTLIPHRMTPLLTRAADGRRKGGAA